MTAREQVEVTLLGGQSPLDSRDHAGGHTVAGWSAGQEAATPQMSYCLAAVGHFTSSGGNIGGSRFKNSNQLIKKLTGNDNLKRHDLDRVATNISIGLLAEDDSIRQNSIVRT